MIRLIVTLSLVFALGACDTIAGAGKDLSKAGTAISKTAKQTQQNM